MDKNCLNYAYIDQPDDNTGFTNNWLTSRHNDKLFEERYGDFPMYDEPRRNGNVYSTNYNDSYRDILKTLNVQRTPLSDFYFSKKNVDHLKKLLVTQIKKRYGYSITAESQSDNEMITVMLNIFAQFGKHWPDRIMEQVAELNLKVLSYVFPRVVSNIQMELTYQRDHGSQPLPMPHPVHVSNAGTKSNRSVTDFFV